MAEETFSVHLEPGGEQFIVAPNETLLQAARRRGLWLPFECGWGECGVCKVRLKAGEVLDLYPEAPGLRPGERAKGVILACQSLPRSPLVLRAAAGEAPARPELWVEDYEARVAAKEEVGPGIYRIRLALDRPARFLPGQYGVFALEATLRRAYSFANLPGEPFLELLVKRYPGRPGSERMASLREGDRLRVELPFGLAYWRPVEGPVALVAGGTGLAPLLSILKAMVREGFPHPVLLFYGARRPEELALRKEAVALLGALPRGEAHLAAEEGGDEEVFPGRVTEVLEVLQEPSRWTYFAAGPPAMIRAFQAWVQAKGVPWERVYYDSFGV